MVSHVPYGPDTFQIREMNYKTSSLVGKSDEFTLTSRIFPYVAIRQVRWWYWNLFIYLIPSTNGQ